MLDFLLNQNIFDIDWTHFKIHINQSKDNLKMTESGSSEETMKDQRLLLNDLLTMMLGLNRKECRLVLLNQISHHS